MINFFKKKKRCIHTQDYYVKRWIEDKTPMIDFQCYECGYRDKGHVHADVAKWETHEIRIKIRK